MVIPWQLVEYVGDWWDVWCVRSRIQAALCACGQCRPPLVLVPLPRSVIAA